MPLILVVDNDSRVSTDAPLSNSSPSNNSFDIQQIAASLEDKMTIKMNKMLNEMKALVVTTPSPVQRVEEQINDCSVFMASFHSTRLSSSSYQANTIPNHRKKPRQLQTRSGGFIPMDSDSTARGGKMESDCGDNGLRATKQRINSNFLH
ncbi:hypothetical protein Tco_1228630 [Tanacetum coccineum]|uniref:Uncharacterized protein n=1 Tax=Tanacetum coccineum TaxID=301880 RepID=A0ABQ5AUG9_9ASTR